MHRLRLLLGLGLGCLQAACGPLPSDADDAMVSPQVREGVALLRSTLPFPEHARLRAVRPGISDGKDRVLCGEVDSANQFAGYEGFVRFMTFSDAGLAVLDPSYSPASQADVREYQLCRRQGDAGPTCQRAMRRTRRLTFFEPMWERLCTPSGPAALDGAAAPAR